MSIYVSYINVYTKTRFSPCSTMASEDTHTCPNSIKGPRITSDKIQFVLSQVLKYLNKQFPGVCDNNDYTREDICCPSHYRTFRAVVVYNDADSAVIGLRMNAHV